MGKNQKTAFSKGGRKQQNANFGTFYRWEKTSNCEFWHFLPMGENIKLRILTISTDGRKGYLKANNAF
jgi:hypothetical protein